MSSLVIFRVKIKVLSDFANHFCGDRPSDDGNEFFLNHPSRATCF